MTALPTPANVPAGWTVRIVVPHRTYHSPAMSPTEARGEADRVTRAVQDIGGGMGLVPFGTSDGRDTWIRGRQVTAVEVGPPAPPRDQPAAPVHVHLHLSQEKTVEEAAEAAAGFIPTPTVLAGRRKFQ